MNLEQIDDGQVFCCCGTKLIITYTHTEKVVVGRGDDAEDCKA